MLASISYVPILRSKSAEVTAFRNLSEEAKDATLPVFLSRPWQNANHFDFTTAKISEAMGGRPFGLGLDSSRLDNRGKEPAQSEFRQLFDSAGGFRAYYDAIEAIENSVPVMLPSNQSSNLLIQLGHAERLDRGLIIHITQSSFIPILNIAERTPPLPHDTIFVVDAGWSRNYEYLEAWTVNTVRRILDALPQAEIVVAASSFPDSFSDIVGEKAKSALERRLYLATRQRFNQAALTYGDWGSTRLGQSGGGGVIPPRIDLPQASGWSIFRAAPNIATTYGDIAAEARASSAFARVPDCYGKRMIESTPGSGGITGPAKGTEARISMHLTISSEAANTLDTDDVAYED